MFGIDFYPTPAEVIDLMLTGTDIAGKYILEPSAGSGNIVDALTARGAQQVIACEIDERLRKILSGKCEIIGDDFLNVRAEQVSHIDMIVMNPPFSDAEKHILHAYDIAPDGCEIISLCNYGTIADPWSSDKRRIKELINNYGLADDLGNCFKNAERTTDCRIGCIHLWKPKSGEEEFDGYFYDMNDHDETGTEAGIMPYNSIRDIVNRYVAAVKMFDKVMATNMEINELTNVFDACQIYFGAKWRNNRYTEVTHDIYKKELQKAAWQQVFRKMNMDKYVTRSVRENINRYIERQSNVPFTMRNVFRTLEMIVGTNDNRMKQTLVEAFDKICSFSADNSTAGEKWKTNSNYMINKRFIVPYITEHSWHGITVNQYVRVGSFDRYVQDINDVIKALCYITGTPYEFTTTLDQINEINVEWGKWHELGKFVRKHKDAEPEYVAGFFRIRGYKKGTMHFEFLDDDVWAKFNIAVAQIRGWELPQNIRKSK